MINQTSRDLHSFIDALRNKLARAESVPQPNRNGHQRAAAVLVPLVYRPGGLSILYTRRSDRLASHRGQVAFPGGRLDRRDPDLLAAALREAFEEVGIEPRQVEVLGSFEGRATRREQIFVTPFVGLVNEPIELRPDPKEVAEIFEVPLAALRDERYRGLYRAETDGTPTLHPAILYGGQTIWGLTYYLTLRFLQLSRQTGVIPDQG